jgi:transcriptional regulator with XRE-family HTH domain
MGNNPTIKEIVREKCRELGLSLAKLAFELRTNQIYLINVLCGRKVSRPLVRRIAEFLHIPDLQEKYEIYLSQRRLENKVAASSKKAYKNKSHKSHKGGIKP